MSIRAVQSFLNCAADIARLCTRTLAVVCLPSALVKRNHGSLLIYFGRLCMVCELTVYVTHKRNTNANAKRQT